MTAPGPSTANMTLEFRLIKAKNLAPKDITGKSDPFIKWTVDGKKKPKSKIIKQNLNPEWNETYYWDGCTERTVIRGEMWDHDLVGKDFMGWFQIDAADMMIAVLEPVEKWLTLQKKGSKDNVSGEVLVHLQFKEKPNANMDANALKAIAANAQVGAAPSSIAVAPVPPPSGGPGSIPPEYHQNIETAPPQPQAPLVSATPSTAAPIGGGPPPPPPPPPAHGVPSHHLPDHSAPTSLPTHAPPPSANPPSLPPHGGPPSIPPHGGPPSLPPHGGAPSVPHENPPSLPPHGGPPAVPPHGAPPKMMPKHMPPPTAASGMPPKQPPSVPPSAPPSASPAAPPSLPPTAPPTVPAVPPPSAAPSMDSPPADTPPIPHRKLPTPPQAPPAAPEKPSVRAVFDYAAANPTELSLSIGSVYTIDKEEEGWYQGTDPASGAFGWFPGNYVEKI